MSPAAASGSERALILAPLGRDAHIAAAILAEAGLEARICRAVYYELVALAVPEMVAGRRMLGVWSQRRFFALGDLPHGVCDLRGA